MEPGPLSLVAEPFPTSTSVLVVVMDLYMKMQECEMKLKKQKRGGLQPAIHHSNEIF